LGNSFGLPVGISFIGTAFSEPTLIKLASGFEPVVKARLVPKFLPSLPNTEAHHGPSAQQTGLIAASPSAHDLKSNGVRESLRYGSFFGSGLLFSK
jgi:hypothetical protein